MIVQVDVYDYLTLVGCLEDRSQAFVVKRVGWLAAWNPCRPEGYIELALDTTEDRQVAKVCRDACFVVLLVWCLLLVAVVIAGRRPFLDGGVIVVVFI